MTGLLLAYSSHAIKAIALVSEQDSKLPSITRGFRAFPFDFPPVDSPIQWEIKRFAEGMDMTMTVRAIYTGGVLRPVEPLALAEGETVVVTVGPAPAATTLVSEEEVIRRIQACKTYQEWLEVTNLLPGDDGGYDIVKSLD